MGRWMINCKEHSKLVSENLDRPISFWGKVSVKMHELLCPACNQLKAQLEMIRKACRSTETEMTPEELEKCRLSTDASERMKAALNKALTKEKGAV